MSKTVAITLVLIPLALGAELANAAETLVPASAPFSDVTAPAGLKYIFETYGAAWGNFDGNLYPDLVVSNHREKPGLYANSGTGVFKNMTAVKGTIAEWDAHAHADTHGGTWADLNNDGRQDLLVTIGRTGTNTQQLLMNETGGSGQAVLRMRDDEWGINPATNPGLRAWGGRNPIWLDYDYDGSMDVMIASFGGGSPLLHQEYNASLGRQRLVDKALDVGFYCDKIHYGFLLDVYTPPPAISGPNDYRPELFCAGEGNFPEAVQETSHLVTRTRNSGATYMGFNLVGFKAEIFRSPTSTTRTTVTKIPAVPDSAVGDFNNDGLQDLFLVRGASRPSGSHFYKSVDGKSNLEILFQSGERGVAFYASGDTFAIDIDWNKDSNTAGFRDPPLYIGGKNGVVKNIGFPKSGNTLLQRVNTQTADYPYHNHLDVSPALTLANFEGAPYRNPALYPYFQLWFEYDGAGKRVWYFRHYGLGQSYGAGYTRVQVPGTMAPGAVKKNGAKLYDTGLGGTEVPMAPMLLLQQRHANPDGSTQGVFVEPTLTASMKEKVQCVSATAGDFDNDGDTDVFMACRGPASNGVDYLYQNQFHNTDGMPTGQPNFIRVLAKNGSGPGAGGAEGPIGAAIADHVGTGDSAVSADYDLDGFLDLFVANGYNMRPRYAGGPYGLYHNDAKNRQLSLYGKNNNWIQLDLVGAGTAASKTTKDAYGARVYIVEGGNRVMMREKNGGYHRWSQDHQRLHFGLAQRNSVNVEVIWPNGVVNRFNGVAANHVYQIAQSPAELTELK